MQARDNEVFEDIITRMYVGLVHPGDTCLDGGASLGLHTVRLARLVGPEGTVFALEPEPSSARSLEALLRDSALGTSASFARRSIMNGTLPDSRS